MKKKLTLVSVIVFGVTSSRFVLLPCDDTGKAIIPFEYLSMMAIDNGAKGTGSTFSIG